MFNTVKDEKRMQRQRADEPLEALSTGREQLIEEAVQSRSTGPSDLPREEAVREVRARAPRREPPAPAPVPRTDARGELLAALTSRQALRRAILLQEVLGPPKGLQP